MDTEKTEQKKPIIDHMTDLAAELRERWPRRLSKR